MASAHGHGGFEFVHHGNPNNPFHTRHASVGLYTMTFVILMVLLVVTVALYYVDLSKIIPIPGINLIVAMIVAVTKAAFVVRNFMNLQGGTKLTFLWGVIGFVWLLLMGGIFMDYLSRQWIDQSGWQDTPFTSKMQIPVNATH
jgi:caa(3)-type oxidase subunit IV